MDRKEILEKVNRVKYWRHQIDLGDGILTPGTHAFDYPRMPEDLRGKTVLDIGAWDGMDSFEAERRGAKRVLATDIWYDPKWSKELWEGIRKGMEGFLTAREILGSKVEYKNIDVYDMSPETVGEFDIVLFLAVLYHLPDSLLALRKIASVTKEMVVVESAVVKTRSEDIPLMAFKYTNLLPGKEPSCTPNLLCLKQLILAAGFKNVEISISNVRIPEPPRGTISNGTYLRCEPDMLAKTITVLDKGKSIIVLGSADGETEIDKIRKDCWYRVEVWEQRIQGWVYGASLDLTTGRIAQIKSLSFIPSPRGLIDRFSGKFAKSYRAIAKGYK